MTNDPDAIRADIEATRRELGSNVDALADKVSPSKIAERQADKVKGAFNSVRDRVMGAADDLGSHASSTAGSAGDAVSDATHKAVAKAQGNPFAVGLIAFGVGLLAASLIPSSNVEKQVGEKVKDAAQPLVSAVGDAAKEVGENLKEPAQEAAQAVKESATGAVENVKAEASDAADDVKGAAADAKDTVQGEASSADDDTTGQQASPYGGSQSY
ncbi:DUF3618 domain-containing protein [Rathayibacter sp. YIM 133350]|uniref:DUF3618 domain-containing protein n=1 Tax=Rathayibacter sp. YIM 133350 TaxID=3131992 RepID=UPI00307CF87D